MRKNADLKKLKIQLIAAFTVPVTVTLLATFYILGKQFVHVTGGVSALSSIPSNTFFYIFFLLMLFLVPTAIFGIAPIFSIIRELGKSELNAPQEIKNLIRNEQKYRSLFQYAHIAMWTQDISGLFTSLEQLRDSGVIDLESYLSSNPGKVIELAMKTTIIEVNPAALELFNSSSQEHLIENMERLLTPETHSLFLAEHLAIWDKKEYFAQETVLRTFNGEFIDVLVTFPIPSTIEDATTVPLTIVDLSTIKQAEHRLRNSEYQARTLLENACISIWSEDLSHIYKRFEEIRNNGVTDLDAYLNENEDELFAFAALVKVKHVNSTSLQMFDAKSEQALIKNIADTFGDDAVAVFREEMIALWNKEKNFTSEANFKTLKGKEINGIISLNIPRTIEESYNVPVSIVDITQRVQAEKELKEKEFRLLNAQHMAKLGDWQLNHKSQKLIWSDEVYRIFEKDPNEFVPTYEGFLSCIPAEDRAHLDKEFQNALYGNNRCSVIHRITGKDGSFKYIKELCETQYDENGSPRISEGTAMDITDIHLMQDKLRLSESLSQKMIESAPDSIFLMDNKGNITLTNNTMREITGYSEEELLSMSYVHLVPNKWKQKAKKSFLMLLNDGKITLEIPFKRRDGSEGYSLFTGIRITSEQILGFSKDITEQKEIMEKLNQEDKMQVIGQLAGGIAHDFNNQLGGIMGFTDLLRMELEERAPDLTEYTSQILDGIHHASELTSELLAFSRKGKYRSEYTDINGIIRDVVVVLSHSINKQIKIKQELTTDSTTTKGDPAQLQNMLLNLALNARDAVHGEGEIGFKTALIKLRKQNVQQLPEGEYIAIEIRDSGVGIKEEALPHIFEPFFTTKKLGEGIGMGLAAVYGTVHNHSGSISVESTAGIGTLFSILLPAHETEELVSEQDSITVHRKQEHAQILIVDDEPMLRTVSSRMIQSMGFTANTCQDGVEALDYIENEDEPIDLIILDLVMPGLSGAETFRLIRKKIPEQQILIASGYSIDGEAQELIEEGAMGFIQKPFRAEDLGAAIHQILSTKE